MKKKINIVIYGDSIVSCSFLQPNKRWIKILKNKFNKKYKNLVNLKAYSLNDAILNFKKIKLNNKVNFILFMFGINDSVYWLSKKGKPRVNLNRFKNNICKLFDKTNICSDAKIAFMLSHKFLQNRLDGNKKTHNYNKLVKPDELKKHLIKNKFLIKNITGMNFNPISRQWELNKKKFPINYFCTAKLI